MAALVQAADEPVYAARFLTDDRICTAASALRVWRVDTTAEASAASAGSKDAAPALISVGSIEKPHLLGAIGMDCDAAGSTIVSTGFDGGACIWDSASLALRVRLDSSPSHAWCIAHSRTSPLLLTGAHGGVLHAWDARSGGYLRGTPTGREFIQVVAISPNGALAAAGCTDGSVHMVDVESGAMLMSMPAHHMPVRALAFSHDGLSMYTGGEDRKINVWDVSGGRSTASAAPIICSFSGHLNWVNALAASPNKPVLASASSDRTVKLWDARRRECLRTFEAHSDRVWSVAWNSAGTRIVSSSESGAVGLNSVAGLV